MAGLIPQAFIDELLDRVDLVELIDGRVKLKKSGKNFMACCPFHEEKTPSFSVNPDKQFYHCFGCGASGNAIGFLMAYEHRDFVDVVELLARQQGMDVPREQSGNDAEVRQRQDLYGVLSQSSSFYQEQLRSHPRAQQAREYLQRRGLTSHVAHQFGIGYAPDGWDALLKYFQQQDSNPVMKQQAEKLLLQAGLLIEREGDDNRTGNRVYDRFRHRIMFPIRDGRGRVIGFGGRVLSANDKPKYLNSPETPVFHKGRELYGLYEALQANRSLDRLLVVEGYMDVVALAQYGVTFACATLGTAASIDHLQKAFRHVPEVIFCFDGDDAGRRAARRALEVSLPSLYDGRQVKFLFLPDGEDPDSLIRQHGTDDFLSRLEEAQPLSEFLFDLMGKGLRLDRLEDRARLVSAIAPLIGQLPEGVYKAQLKQLLAAKSQSDLADIQQALNAASMSASRTSSRSKAVEGTPKPLSPKPESRDVGPTSRTSVKSFAGRRDLWDDASALLLRAPDLARYVSFSPAQFAGASPEADTIDQGAMVYDSRSRFFRLLEVLRREDMAGVTPSLNKLLGLWQSLYGAESSQVLYGLAARESLLDPEGQRQQFMDILARLASLPREHRLEALIQKSRQRGLDRQEKQELVSLLTASEAGKGPGPAPFSDED